MPALQTANTQNAHFPTVFGRQPGETSGLQRPDVRKEAEKGDLLQNKT